MLTRRAVLRASLGLAAGGLLAGRAKAGPARLPTFLTTARTQAGQHVACGLGPAGERLFTVALEARGHGVACHPHRPEAIVFARRPGRFAVLIDCRAGHMIRRLEAPTGRHFEGHGAFRADGRLLFTTENDLDTLEGRIGVWDVASDPARVGEFASGGIGPHECLWHPGEDRLVVANGGMATHPDSGRAVLNLATMRANLAYLDPATGEGAVVELEPALRRNSIRHLALAPDGMVVAAMQWQGPDGETPPLLFTHRLGQTPRLLEPPPAELRALRNYVGSVAVSRDGGRIMATSPIGGVAMGFDARGGDWLDRLDLVDVCGIGADASGFLVSSGLGRIGRIDAHAGARLIDTALAWDNHVVATPEGWG